MLSCPNFHFAKLKNLSDALRKKKRKFVFKIVCAHVLAIEQLFGAKSLSDKPGEIWGRPLQALPCHKQDLISGGKKIRVVFDWAALLDFAARPILHGNPAQKATKMSSKKTALHERFPALLWRPSKPLLIDHGCTTEKRRKWLAKKSQHFRNQMEERRRSQFSKKEVADRWLCRTPKSFFEGILGGFSFKRMRETRVSVQFQYMSERTFY